MAIGGFAAMRALQRNDEPERASRPWDQDRDGFVVGEGAGILVLEELEFARRARRADSGGDRRLWHVRATRFISPRLGRWRRRLSRDAQCLRDAGIEPEQIDYINAHGTSTDVGDRVETPAIKRVFGDHAYKVAVSSTKSMTGHLLGGAGGLEAGITVMAIRDQIAPPTINHEHPDAGLRSGLRSQPRAADEDRLRAVELLRFRRNQRLPDLQAYLVRDAVVFDGTTPSSDGLSYQLAL